MDYKEILKKACLHLTKLDGQLLDILEIKKPEDIDYANHLAKTVSKISPILGNMIEHVIVKSLNAEDWQGLGIWERQDPGFPDAIFRGNVFPTPGIEVKTWFPLATEITARFKESVLHFQDEQTQVAIVAWMPEFIIYGKPKIIGVEVISAKSLALARDLHYHNPPSYLVFEPEDTSSRTANLQQTNTNGYVFQGPPDQLLKAKEEVLLWGQGGGSFSADPAYQLQLRGLMSRYPYRLDTNFAKIDRIGHTDLENFKRKILKSQIRSRSIAEWSKIFSEGGSELMELLE